MIAEIFLMHLRNLVGRSQPNTHQERNRRFVPIRLLDR
jgi:hypothetical protein